MMRLLLADAMSHTAPTISPPRAGLLFAQRLRRWRPMNWVLHNARLTAPDTAYRSDDE